MAKCYFVDCYQTLELHLHERARILFLCDLNPLARQHAFAMYVLHPDGSGDRCSDGSYGPPIKKKGPSLELMPSVNFYYFIRYYVLTKTGSTPLN